MRKINVKQSSQRLRSEIEPKRCSSYEKIRAYIDGRLDPQVSLQIYVCKKRKLIALGNDLNLVEELEAGRTSLLLDSRLQTELMSSDSRWRWFHLSDRPSGFSAQRRSMRGSTKRINSYGSWCAYTYECVLRGVLQLLEIVIFSYVAYYHYFTDHLAMIMDRWYPFHRGEKGTGGRKWSVESRKHLEKFEGCNIFLSGNQASLNSLHSSLNWRK